MATELLSPAGTLKSMKFAFAYGADAVYAGQPRYSLRVRNNEFNKIENLQSAIELAHAMGKQFYLASNLSPHNDKVKTYLRDLEPIIAMRPDALIMSDPGLIMLVREQWPEQTIHLSVQANAVNWATVKFWQSIGLSRVILSRELSLDEIAEIKQRSPDMELEVFVHGALCIAYSGRCLLSGYMTHRDSNQGACTNSCRWKYQTHEAQEDVSGDIIPTATLENRKTPESAVHQVSEDQVFLLQEKSRPDEYLPAYEDEHGTYIMNSKDLRAVQHVQRLIEIGVDSLKIEGRTKSHYYAARTAQVYKQAIIDAEQGKPFNMELMGALENLANRGYTEGFYRRHVPSEFQNYEQGISISDQQQFVGEALEYNEEKHQILVDVKNKFETDDVLEIMTPSGNGLFQLQHMHNQSGETVQVAPGSGHQVWVQLPEEITLKNKQDDSQFALLLKNKS